MADYKELLRRAIEALSENNGAARRQVYEKARAALVAQLRAVNPPLPAREITQHRLKLEDCIRQVEQEATEALLHVSAPPPVAPAPGVPPEQQASEAIARALAEKPEPRPAPQPAAQPAPQPAPIVQPRPAASRPVEAKPAPQPVMQPTPAPRPRVTEVAAAARMPDAEIIEAPMRQRPAATRSTEAAPVMRAREVASEQPADFPASRIIEGPAPIERRSELTSTIEEVIAAAQRDAAEGRGDLPPPPERSGPKPVVKQAVRIEAEPKRRAPAAEGVARRENVSLTGDAASRQMGLEAVISAAMSSVREVDVEPARPRMRAGEDVETDDNPQASIDRAIAALDREVKGAVDGEAPAISAAVAKERPAAKSPSKDKPAPARAPKSDAPPLKGDDYWSEADAAQFEAGQEEFENAPVGDEPGGRGGLTIFLALVVVLLLAAGGGGFWAWREGYVDISALLARVGFGSPAATTQEVAAAVPETAAEPAPVTVNTQASGNSTQGNTTQASTTPTLPANGAGIEEAGKIDERLPADAGVRVVEPTPSQQATSAVAAPATTPDSPATAFAQPEVPADPAGAAIAQATPQAEATPPVQEALIDPAQVDGSQSILLEEQGAGATGPAPFSGSVEWSRDVDELGIPVIKATARIPARNLTVEMLFRKNSDAALPASHLIEIDFSVLDSFVGGGIANLPGVMFKNVELAQGTPLAGASARVFDNQFLFALSADSADLATNNTLMRDQAWVDLLIVYSTGRRAILTLEKGAEGTEIFNAVLDAWTAN